MKAMRLSDSGQPPVLIEENVPWPQPGQGELLVQIYAAGVTPTEVLWYPTTHKKNGEERSRAVPGHEFSGVVEALQEMLRIDSFFCFASCLSKRLATLA